MAEIILPPEEETPETPQAPELNIDKPTENSKVITIEFEAKKTNKVSTKDTNQQLYTTDTDAWFEFKETSLEGANGTYSVVFKNGRDGSIFQRTGDVVNGVAYYKIPHQEIRHAGAWRGQVVYTLSNGDTTSREFGYDVKGHILDGKDVREIVVEDFETLMSQLNSMKDNAELELADLVNTAERNELERQQFYESLVDDINDLQENYQELLDTGVLQTNINTKLEALEEEYAPKLTEVTAQLAQKASKVEVETERARIDNLIKVDGSTDNAETADIRIGFGGKEYNSAGEHVRAISSGEAVNNLSPNNFDRKFQVLDLNIFDIENNVIEKQWVNEDGEFTYTASYNIMYIDVKSGETYTWFREHEGEFIRLTGRYIVVDASDNVLLMSSSGSPIEIPEGGVRIYKNIPISNFNTNIMAIVGSETPTEYTPYRATALKEDIVDLSNVYKKIEDLEEGSGVSTVPYDHESNIPDYWLPHLEAKVKEIKGRQASLGRDGYTFIQMADFHLNTSMLNSPSLLKYIADNCDIRYIINTGDYANRVSFDPKEVLLGNMALVYKMFEGTLSKTLPSLGNHDAFWGDNGLRKSLTQAEIYAHYFLPFISRNDNIVYADTGNYYYCDDPHGKIRFINLNCFDAPNEDLNPDGTPIYNSGSTFAYSENQINWIYEEALDTPEDWAVVLFSHVTPRNVSGTINPHAGALLVDILDAYNTGTSFTGGYDYPEDTNFNVSERTYDFTNRGGEVIMYTSGHFHKDRSRVWGGIHMQTISLDSIDAHQGEPGYEEIEYKTPGTTTEHAFDVVTVDRVSGDVYITRIGAGSDREFNYKNPE